MEPVSLDVLARQTEAAFGKTQPAPIARSLTRALLASVLGESEAWVAANGSWSVPTPSRRKILNLLLRIQVGEPLAHLVGSAPFYGQTFLVTKATLIPRPETEGLVDLILARWPSNERSTIAIDIGTGSGCIGTILALKRGAGHVILTDVSKRALNVASKNLHAALKDQAKAATLLQTPLFSRLIQQEVRRRSVGHLLIAANLPYLPNHDRKTLSASVTRFEPHRALFGGQVGSELIIKLLNQVKRFARSHEDIRIDLVLEFDPPYAKALLREALAILPGADARIDRDSFERERFLCVTVRERTHNDRSSRSLE